MKNVPDIAPEIRGLLEEIVANPRSAIRLAPRRALSTWFDTGETVRASDVARTKAERHLVEAHREELAALLCEASWISYWKAPGLNHRPVGKDGMPFCPTEQEPAWRRRAAPEVSRPTDRLHGIDLLRDCLAGIKPKQGWALAQASLSLVPSDITRCHLAHNALWDKPRTAIALFERIFRRTQQASLKAPILQSLGAQACYLGLLGEARNLYRESAFHAPQSPHGWSYAFNLSCFLEDERGALESAVELGRLAAPQDPRVQDTHTVLREWWRGREEAEVKRVGRFIYSINDRIPEVARVLCEGVRP